MLPAIPILILGTLGTSALITFLLWPEMSSVPGIMLYLKKCIGMDINYFIFATYLFLILIVIPLSAISFVLISLKRHTFSHQKPIKFSYAIVSLLFCIALVFKVGLFFLDMLFLLSSKDITKYIFIRVAKLYPETFLNQNLFPRFITSLVVSIYQFLLIFLAAEIYLTYLVCRRQRSIFQFVKQNIFCVIMVCLISFGYFVLQAYFFACFKLYRNSEGVIADSFFCILVTICLMYVYSIIIIYH